MTFDEKLERVRVLASDDSSHLHRMYRNGDREALGAVLEHYDQMKGHLSDIMAQTHELYTARKTRAALRPKALRLDVTSKEAYKR